MGMGTQSKDIKSSVQKIAPWKRMKTQPLWRHSMVPSAAARNSGLVMLWPLWRVPLHPPRLADAGSGCSGDVGCANCTDIRLQWYLFALVKCVGGHREHQGLNHEQTMVYEFMTSRLMIRAIKNCQMTKRNIFPPCMIMLFPIYVMFTFNPRWRRIRLAPSSPRTSIQTSVTSRISWILSRTRRRKIVGTHQSWFWWRRHTAKPTRKCLLMLDWFIFFGSTVMCFKGFDKKYGTTIP